MTKLIAHRGNITGSNIYSENSPAYIEYAISRGFDAEIDIWYNKGELYLGHDSPKHLIDIKFILKYQYYLWCHIKNEEALNILRDSGLNYFWHESDAFVLTSKGYVWAFPSKIIYPKYVNLMPEINNFMPSDFRGKQIFAICSDYVEYFKENL